MLQRYEKGGEKGASVRALAPDFFRHWSRFYSCSVSRPLPVFPCRPSCRLSRRPSRPPSVLPLIPPLVPPFVLRSPWLVFSLRSILLPPVRHRLARCVRPCCPISSSASAASVPFSLLAAARPARLFPAPDDVPPVLLRKPLRTPRCPPFTRSGTPSPPRCARSVRPRRPVTSFRPKNCPIVREKMQKITLPALSRFLIVIFFTFLKVFIPLCRRTPCCGPLPAGARGDDRARRRNALTTTGQRI